ncbi:NADP-dependent succinic semialdehyde dehydrogenase [Geodermatophilus sabuli]|uniref:Succinate-semialdehyde dehydrogenase / glutarate-semialdehyde dehydrogenase n=1 Tax=Geodermatophilus sabuli TaxID=1564158 RepID=A0A285EMT2_9ACTN|nr:NADP-dependent succinic semialdehyde dehydrogenase [Geodermatophilus sabuli]MBB3087049.1 succinate-semialdehyde dehydrogenase/glutarate-semialdehyde dehydrogenase [Geodermatophilus sabuli]SNX99386.1 succinate-semialdehyde dehydrogenase / glutarate-semialdehyde dehydrogenase [Geodermatophilus sabuli]
MAIATINPATGETLKTYEPLSEAALEDKLARAAAAFAEYRLTTPRQRAGWLRAAADVLEGDTDAVAELMTTEMGKTLASAKAEAGKCVKALRYYAEHGEDFLQPKPTDAEAVGAIEAYVVHQPLGVVLAIMPWNFPLWQAMRFAAPALMAGNVGLLKHASNVPQTALYMEELFRKAGFPADVFQTLLIGSGTVERVIRDDRVVAATLTGSGPAGQSVAAVAGDALKKTVLELGGSDPFIVMPSADLDKAAEVAVTARCQNNGQSCIAAKRFFVHTDVAEEFTRLFAEKMAALTVGDPMDDGTKVGPLATEDGREDVERYVQDAVDKGATVVVGGRRVDRPGWFYEPTLVSGVTPEMAMHSEEVFGPVAALYTVADLDEAIRIANDHVYGLGANLWSEDQGERLRFIRDVQSGMAFVNGMVTSYPELPFGGVKQSGYGRELTEVGMYEFANAKTVWIGPPGRQQGEGDTAAAASE